MKRLISILMIPVTLIIGACSSPTPNRNPVGQMFPTVTGTSLTDRSVTLPKAWAGQPVLLMVGRVRHTLWFGLQVGIPAHDGRVLGLLKTQQHRRRQTAALAQALVVREVLAECVEDVAQAHHENEVNELKDLVDDQSLRLEVVAGERDAALC